MPATLTTRRPETHPGQAYVLMTAAHNEEVFIEETIKSVVSQTIQPRKWVIVSDHSTDGTDAIITRYAKEYGFIQFVRVTRPPGRSFGSKGLALQAARSFLEELTFDYIGNI